MIVIPVLLLIIAAIVTTPVGVIWCVNTLLSLNIAYSLSNYVAIVLLYLYSLVLLRAGK